NLFKEKRDELIGPPRPITVLTHVADTLKPLKNFGRIPGDIIARLASLGRKEDLRQSTVEITVLPRDALLTAPSLQQLFQVEGNKEILRDLMEQELYKEANAEQFLMI